MTLAATPLLRSVSLEVRYAQKLLYYDRCGSTADRLEGVLGKPFKASVPTMEAAEVKSEVEQIVFKFSPTAFSAEHQFTSTPIRILDLVGDAWSIVAEQLQVEQRVTRLGMRFIYILPVSSPEEGGALILKTTYLQGITGWNSALGHPRDAMLSVVSGIDPERAARVALTTIKSGGTPELFNERFQKFMPAYAVQSDIDVHTPGEIERRVGRGQLKEFAKFAALWAKSASIVLHKQIVGDSPS